MRPVIDPVFAAERLAQIFPKAAFDSVLSNPLAGAAVATIIYTDAVAQSDPDDTFWVRPSTVMWATDDVLAHDSDEDRLAWREAAMKNRTVMTDLLAGWGMPFEQRYADNTRETLRDETFRGWKEYGAIRERPGLATSSSKPRWALEPDFLDLFDPTLLGDDLDQAIDGWRTAHLTKGAMLKAAVANYEQSGGHTVKVVLPSGGGTRELEPGIASLILKGVIEEWAPARMSKPVVISISEPGDKIYKGDQGLLGYLGISINVSELLPDAVLADTGADPVQFWIVEAVNTDGPITDGRKADLIAWAEKQNIPASDCYFLTAFRSRNDAAARRRLKDLAEGTFAWYADEPHRELAWYDL